MAMTLLTRIDPAQHADRWYHIVIQPSLFNTAVVCCGWGSRRTAFQQMRIVTAASLEEATHLAERLVAQKIKRGYRVSNPAP